MTIDPEPGTERLAHPPGWDQAWSEAAATASQQLLARRVPAATALGRVVCAQRGACLVATADVPDGPVRATWGADVLAAAAGDPEAPPVTGDWVLLARWPDGRETVEVVLPRRHCVRRAQVARGSSRAQVLAANVDRVAVVEPLVPEPRASRIERLLALAWSGGAAPVVVLTKSDLVPDADHAVVEVAALAPGCAVLAVASTTGAGLAPLRSALADGSTLALLGASGSGKSTLLNALAGADVMAAGRLRPDGKGRHTTATRELHAAAGGAVVDTPGLRSIGLPAEADEHVVEVFGDVEELAGRCRFGDCAHTCEPGCAVLAAVEAGELTSRRLESWQRLGREAAHQARRTDARLRAEHARSWARVTRDARRRSRRRPGPG